MNMMGLGAISILLLLIAWWQWSGREEENGHTICQGVLLNILTVAWFLRIVLGPLPNH